MTGPAVGSGLVADVTPDLPGSWSRLSPLSPVARGGRALVAVAVVAGPRQLFDRGDDRVRLWTDLALAAVLVVGGTVSWIVTRWRVAGGELQVETGLLRRQSLRVPLVRVQAVDVVRPLAARLLGVTELRLVLAGSGSGKARLSYLQQRRAVEVRAQLLALAHGLADDTPEAPERPVVGVPNGRLVLSTLLAGPALTLAAIVPVLVVLLLVAPDAIGAVLGGLSTLVIALATAVGRRLNVELNFVVAESPDGLRLRSGLLQTRAETIPYGRVQAVRLLEPLLWRPFGWCRLEVDVAHQREHEVGEQDERQLTRALLPVGDRAQAGWFLSRVLPGAGLQPPVGSGAPRRARWKAPLSYGRLRWWADAGYAVGRTGRLQAQTVVVPLGKVQSVRWTQGPVQRRLALASVHVDTAGKGWHAVARDRDRSEADRLVADLPGRARAARATAPRRETATDRDTLVPVVPTPS